jgi:hypothetical protein
VVLEGTNARFAFNDGRECWDNNSGRDYTIGERARLCRRLIEGAFAR